MCSELCWDPSIIVVERPLLAETYDVKLVEARIWEPCGWTPRARFDADELLSVFLTKSCLGLVRDKRAFCLL